MKKGQILQKNKRTVTENVSSVQIKITLGRILNKKVLSTKTTS